MKSGKVSQVYSTGDSFSIKDRRTGEDVTMNIFHVAFENGFEANFFTTSNEAGFRVGDTINYEEKGQDKSGNNKIKIVRDTNGGGRGGWGGKKEDPERQVYIVRQSSLKVACEFVLGTKGKTAKMDDIKALADDLTEWVMRPIEPNEE